MIDRQLGFILTLYAILTPGASHIPSCSKTSHLQRTAKLQLSVNRLSLSSYDFSTLYTTLPHNLIKDKLIDLIERTFQKEGSSYLACNDRNAFLLWKNLKNIIHSHFKMYVMH